MFSKENEPIVLNDKNLIEKIFDFAYIMANDGLFYANFQGKRTKFDIFLNGFQGKIAEAACINILIESGFDLSFEEHFDLDIKPKGTWDKGDIIIPNEDGELKYIDVKSVKGNSEFLLIEDFRHNMDGTPKYANADGTKHILDAYSFVRVEFNKKLNFLNPFVYSKEEILEGLVITTTYMGSITRENFWRKKLIAPRGTKCYKENFMNIWKRKKFECEKDNKVINANRTKYLQVTNYLMHISGLNLVDTIFGRQLKIKKAKQSA